MRWLWKKSVDDEVSEELDLHLAMRTREYVARGMDPAAAREAALRRFGNLETVRKTCSEIGRKRDKDMRRRETFTELRQDITFAVRQLVAHPAFSLIAVLTLALGIGASTAIFSVVNAVVLRPLPVLRPERLVNVFGVWAGEDTGIAGGGYTGLEGVQGVFSKIAVSEIKSFILSEGESERTIGMRASASYFDVFGVAPAHGRVFRADEDQPGRDQVVVLSDRLWKRRFGGDLAILGQQIRINELQYTVIGIMPPSFDFTSESEELWVPIAFTPERRADWDSKPLDVVGRLRDGATTEQATQAVKNVAVRIRQIAPAENSALDFRLAPYMETFVGDYRTRLFVLLGAVGLVLLIACGNVANLLLARGAARWREVAIRTALGASRGRIIRQLLTESAVLSLVSAAVGLLLAWAGMRYLVTLVPDGVPRVEQTSLDGTVLAFTLVLSLVSSFVFGLAPALRAARVSVSQTLKDGGRGSAGTRRDWLRPALISAEIALAVLLLVGAGLLIRSALELQRVRPGFNPEGVISARLSLPPKEYVNPERILVTMNRITEEVSQSPGVRSVAIATPIPMGRGVTSNGLLAEGKSMTAEDLVQSILNVVTPDYFRTMEIPIVRGRGFLPSDRKGSQRVMVVNEQAAAALYPGQDPIGKKVDCCESLPDGKPMYKIIVGVAGNLHSFGLADKVEPEFYLPAGQVPDVAWDWVQRTFYLVARSEGSPEALVPALRKAVASIDPNVPVYQVSTMEERMAGSLATARFNTLLLTLLGVIGLILSVVGIYGVIAYFVTQRTAEIGVRMALGATPRHVILLVLRQAVIPVGVGVLVGLAASAAATRVLAAYLVGVEPTDPLTLATVVAVLAGAALLASFMPARRAASVPPTEALQAL
ncbi:MAG TPA: ABC transporter permease [Thermoanaerobaculia bacterium]|nr:ABC transporter permease [Thermoanaerobaculia bacterium]